MKKIVTLLGVLALVAGFTAVSVQANDGGATAAKKKCKKKKKKKCKKKHAAATPPATPAAPAKPVTPAKPPVVRAELDWTSTAGGSDLDLQVWNPGGFDDCGECGGLPEFVWAGTDGDQTDGFERVSTVANPSTTKYTFRACGFNIPQDTPWELDVVYANGTTDTATGTAHAADEGGVLPGSQLVDPGGSYVPTMMQGCPTAGP